MTCENHVTYIIIGLGFWFWKCWMYAKRRRDYSCFLLIFWTGQTWGIFVFLMLHHHPLLLAVVCKVMKFYYIRVWKYWDSRLNARGLRTFIATIHIPSIAVIGCIICYLFSPFSMFRMNFNLLLKRYPSIPLSYKENMDFQEAKSLRWLDWPFLGTPQFPQVNGVLDFY